VFSQFVKGGQKSGGRFFNFLVQICTSLSHEGWAFFLAATGGARRSGEGRKTEAEEDSELLQQNLEDANQVRLTEQPPSKMIDDLPLVL